METSSGAASNQMYRSRSGEEDEDDDDLSDFDDVLQSFNASKPKGKAPQLDPSLPSTTRLPATAASPDETGEDFEASLMEGMESLLRQLAGEHPPGVMPDLGVGEHLKPSSSSESREPSPLSKEEEEQRWQKAVDSLLSGEGLAALGLDDKAGEGPEAPTPPKSANQDSGLDLPAVDSYEETLRKTFESLKSAGQKSDNTAGDGSDEPDLAALLASLGNDPDLLKNLNTGEDGDGDFEGVLEGMMAQLMNKEVLEEPMTELASKYPIYLASPPPGVSYEDLAKYRQQSDIVNKIVATFRKPTYSDGEDGKVIAKLVSDMQDLGGPPKEILGELPKGFDFGGLGDDEGCTVM